MFRVIADPPKPVGLLYGFLIGSQVDDAIRKALPGWAILLDATAPGANQTPPVSMAMLAAGRALVRAPAGTPVGLAGWSNGCLNGVRSTLLGNLVGKDLRYVHVADGTHASVPPTDSQVQVWADLVDRARKGEITFTATCSSMTYTKDIKTGKPGRAWPTSWILGRALYGNDPANDMVLEVGSPIVEGNLYVEKFPSPEQATIEAADAHRYQVNTILSETLAKYWWHNPIDTDGVFDDIGTPAQIVSDVAAEWLNQAPTENMGRNRATVIDKWLADAGDPNVGDPYCAAFVSECIREAFRRMGQESPLRGSAGARNLMAQFEKAGQLVRCRTPNTNTALPIDSWIHAVRPGSVAFWARPPDPAHGHAAIVVDCGNEDFFVTEANSDRVFQPITGNIYAVSQSGKHLNDPLLLGFGVWDVVHPG